jgi:hypothetical protein
MTARWIQGRFAATPAISLASLRLGLIESRIAVAPAPFLTSRSLETRNPKLETTD